jgi:hypothetical protein
MSMGLGYRRLRKVCMKISLFCYTWNELRCVTRVQQNVQKSLTKLIFPIQNGMCQVKTKLQAYGGWRAVQLTLYDFRWGGWRASLAGHKNSTWKEVPIPNRCFRSRYFPALLWNTPLGRFKGTRKEWNEWKTSACDLHYWFGLLRGREQTVTVER